MLCSKQNSSARRPISRQPASNSRCFATPGLPGAARLVFGQSPAHRPAAGNCAGNAFDFRLPSAKSMTGESSRWHWRALRIRKTASRQAWTSVVASRSAARSNSTASSRARLAPRDKPPSNAVLAPAAPLRSIGQTASRRQFQPFAPPRPWNSCIRRRRKARSPIWTPRLRVAASASPTSSRSNRLRGETPQENGNSPFSMTHRSRQRGVCRGSRRYAPEPARPVFGRSLRAHGTVGEPSQAISFCESLCRITSNRRPT